MLLTLLVLMGCDPVTPPETSAADPNAALLASLRAQPLEVTRHGACRMDCRGIDDAEVKALLRSGTWKPDRTRTDGSCPSHAIEGRSADGQNLRVVFAACADETRVVTAIDLDREHDCNCP